MRSVSPQRAPIRDFEPKYWQRGAGFGRLPRLPPAPPEYRVADGAIGNPLPRTSLSILLPALNEEAGIEEVLKRIPRTILRGRGLAWSIYLLDGNSTDRTRLVASRYGAEVVLQSGHGKGAAFREFVPKIREDLTVILDSDGTYPPEAIPDLVEALRDDRPVALGSRLRGSIDEGAMSTANLLGNRLLSGFASFLFGTRISDVCSGMWAFESDRLKSLDLSANGFDLEADIFAECSSRGIAIAEVPIRFERRIGRPKLRLRAGFKIGFRLLKKRLRAGSHKSVRAVAPPTRYRDPEGETV